VTAKAWEHQREVREALHTIVSDPQLGIPALSNPQAMSNLLKHLLPDAPQETSVLVAEAGLAELNLLTGFDAAAAGHGCPPPPGSTSGQSRWHSNDNAGFGSRAGQILECYRYGRDTRIPVYLWTLPTQRVILVANDQARGATYASLGRWWSRLSYG
jgi:hypothetical protein